MLSWLHENDELDGVGDGIDTFVSWEFIKDDKRKEIILKDGNGVGERDNEGDDENWYGYGLWIEKVDGNVCIEFGTNWGYWKLVVYIAPNPSYKII